MSPITTSAPAPPAAPVSERLYRRLPRIYRRRDQEKGEPLRALMAVLERELTLLEDDVDGLYENAFIETCQEWVVPYLADLLGVRTLGAPPTAGADPRTQVASALTYRQRKGTPVVLERTIRDVLGWFARVVEYFDFLAHTQNVNFRRPGRGGTFDLRRADELTAPGDPFATPIVFRNVDVRRIASERGRFNVPDLGIFLWRLISFAIPSGPGVAPAGDASGQRFHFDPLGRDVQLFNHGVMGEDLVRHAAEHELPVALSREILSRDKIENDPSLYYGADKAFLVEADGAAEPFSDLVVADLGSWITSPPVPPVLNAGEMAIDPELGRIFFATAPADPATVRVRYHYGAAAPTAGGPYDRRDTLTEEGAAALVLTVSKTGGLTTLQDAVDTWDAAGKPVAVIRVEDSEVYSEDLTILLPATGCLALEAADGARPVLNPSSFRVVGAGAESELVLNGFWIEGVVELEEGLRLLLTHSTLVPRAGRSSLTHTGDASELRVCVTFSVTGALDGLPADLASLLVEDSVVDAASGGATPTPALVSGELLAVVIREKLRLAVTQGAAAPVTVELDKVPTDLASASAQLAAALTGGGFPAATVTDLGTRLLTSSGTAGEELVFAPAGSDLTANELRLIAPPARAVEGLFSGRHEAFVPFSQPRMRVTLGTLGPRIVALAEIPDTSQKDDVARLLRDALVAAGNEPTFRDAEVLALDDTLLLVRPGVAGDDVFFEDLPGSGATAADLGLAPLAVQPVPAVPDLSLPAQIDGALSDVLPALGQPNLGFDVPRLRIRVGTDPLTELRLTTLPESVGEAATALGDAATAAGLPTPVTVVQVGDRLLVAPADPTAAVVFQSAPGDVLTVADLALPAPPAELVRGRLSGVLPASLGLTAPELRANLGGAEDRKLTLDDVPTDLASAAQALERALRDPETGNTSPPPPVGVAFTQARVVALSRRLLVLPGKSDPAASVSVVFSDEGTDPTATELGLTAGTPLNGLFSGRIDPFPAFPPPEIEVRFATGAPRTVVLRPLPSSPPIARLALEAGLRSAGNDPSFLDALVALIAGDQLLVISGRLTETVRVSTTQDDVFTAEELFLEEPPAQMTEGLLSGELDPFPDFGAPEVAVTLGATGPVSASFATVPQTLAEVPPALQAAVNAADASPTFQNATVDLVGTQLLVRPGSPGDAVTVAITADDDMTAPDLALVAPPAVQLEGVLSGDLATFPNFPQPVVRIDVGGAGPQSVTLPVTPPATLPTTLTEAVATLNAGLTNTGIAATAVQVGDRILVRSEPLDVTQTVVLSAGPSDTVTVDDLALGSAAQAVSGRLSGDLATFPSFTPANTLRIDVTIDGVTRTAADITPPPTDLADAATKLQAAIRAADPATDFANATVSVVDTRLLVEPGNAGKSLSLVDNAATDEPAAAPLQLTDALSEAAFGSLSGDLSGFTGLERTPEIEITQGAVTRTATFTAVPTTLAEARTLFEGAFQAEFAGAAVRQLGNFLFAEPGTAGQSLSFANAATGPATSDLLQLTGRTSSQALLSGDLAAFTGLTTAPIKLDATLAGLTRELTLADPSTLDEARQQLEAALRGADPSPSYADARVGVADDRLVVLPGVPGDPVSFAPNAASPDVVSLLKLDAANAQPFQGLLSGNLLPDPLVPEIDLTRAPRLDVTLGAVTREAVLSGLPDSVESAAGLLREAIHAVAGSDLLFQNAEVEAAGSRLLVTAATDPADPATQTTQIAFTDPPAGFATATALSLTADVATVGELGLASAPLPFPTLTAATPQVDVTVDTTTTTLTFASTPTDLGQLSVELETRLQTPSAGAKVRELDGALLVLPGNPGDTIGFSPAPADPDTAVELALVEPPAAPIEGLLSSALTAPVTLTGNPALEVRLGSEGPLPVLLGTVSNASLEEVRRALERALHRSGTTEAFTRARVVLVDDQLLILPGSARDPSETAPRVEVLPAADNPATVTELGLDTGTLTQGLVSGNPADFPVLSSAPLVSMTLVKLSDSSTDTLGLVLSSLPDNAAEARAALEAAIRRKAQEAADAEFENAFAGATVRVVDGRLLVTPGDPGMTVDPFTGPIAPDLRLDAPQSLAADGLLSGLLTGFTGLSFDTPELDVTLGTDGPHRTRLKNLPTDLASAAGALEQAVRDAAPSATFQDAVVKSVPDLGRLLITPGRPGDAVAVSPAAGDSQTLRNLGLDLLTPAGGLLSAMLGAFSTLELQATLGAAAQTLTLARPPQSLAEAATLLQEALRAADPADSSFALARVEVIDDRLLVTSGDPGETVSFAEVGASTTVTDLKLDDDPAVPAGDRAVPAGALLSGNLEDFPTFLSGPSVDVRIGEVGPHTALLPFTPTDLAEARQSLEEALRAAVDDPAFTRARVETADNRLVVVPGLPEPITITASAADTTTVVDLALTGADVRQVGALLSGELPAGVKFRSATPELAARMLPDPTTLTVDMAPALAVSPPADEATLAEIRDQLEAELRGGLPVPAAFENAMVLPVDGDRLLVVPGADASTVVLETTAGDTTTVADLALAVGQAVGAGDRPGPPISLVRTTVFGRLTLEELVLASEVLFTEPVVVVRQHVGCVRYSYLPPGSRVPRRFRSQPDMALELAVRRALEERARALGLASVERLDDDERAALTANERDRTLKRLEPRFTSTVFGDPGYAQLALDAAPELRTGAENGSEIGAFHHLDEPRRRAQLRELLDEFLRFGLDAGIFEVT